MFTRYSDKDGLVHNFVTCITQDEKGFLWFATEDGFSRFDGYAFKNYERNIDDPNSISDDAILSMCADTGGVLWFGTDAGGINRFDSKTETYTTFRAGQNTQKDLSSDRIKKIFIDSRNHIWVGTDTGLNRMVLNSDRCSQEKCRLDRFGFGESYSTYRRIADNNVNDIIEDKNGDIWIATSNGLSRGHYTDSLNIQFTSYRHEERDPNSLMSNSLSCLEVDSEGLIWIGTSDKGIIMFDPASESFLNFQSKSDDHTSLSSNNITKLLNDPIDPDILWIGTWMNGFNSFNRKSQKAIRYMSDDMNVPESAITDMYQDNGGNIWIASFGLGISRFNIHQQNFLSFTAQHSREKGLPVPFITNMVEVPDQSGKFLWLTSGGGGLLKYDIIKDEYTQFIYKPTHPESNSFNVFRIIQYQAPENNQDKKLLWIGTSDDGLAWFDITTERFIDSPSPANQQLKQIKGTVHDLLFYKKKNHDLIFIGTMDRGGYIYDFGQKVLKNIRYRENDPETIRNDVISHFFEDDSGNIWICTMGGGISIYNPLTEEMNHLLYKEGTSNGLPHSRINSVYQDTKGRIWIATFGSGFCMFDRKKNTYYPYNENDGLPDNCIFGILEDNEGFLWISTQKGLVRFDPDEKTFTHFDYSDGIPLKNFLNDAFYKRSDGSLIFGGMGGFTIVQPSKLKQNSSRASLVLTNFTINNKSLDSYHEIYLKKNIAYTKNIVLPFSHNTFAFEFSYLDFFSPLKNHYRYKLNGLDEEWISSDASKRYASYTQVPPGKYIFYLKAANNSGFWNPEPLSINLTILPPWYRTNLAYLIYLLMGLGSIIILWRIQVNRLKMRQQIDMEHYQAEKLKELDESKSRFFANISHEFRTPLTLIEGPIRQLKNGEYQGNLKEAYNLILKNTKRLVDLINQLLDLSKLESKKLKLQAANQNIVPLLSGLVQSFESLARRKNIEYTFSKPKKEIDLYIDQEKFEKIIINLLSNAFKFTPEKGRITVGVLIHPESHFTSENGEQPKLKISISNSGSFLKPDQIEHIFDRFYQVNELSIDHLEGTGIGLALVKELVELHHGYVSVQSDHDIGTIFTLQLPLGKDHLSSDEISDTFEEPIEKEQISEDSLDTSHQKLKSLSVKMPHKQRVLIVEDNQDVRLYVAGLINSEYSIFEAENGKQALDIARKKNPDLVITDVMMPEMNGMEFCRRLKKDIEISHIPIIMLTARADIEDKLEGLELGADDYIEKPFEAEELKLRIRNIFKQRDRLRNRLNKDAVLRPEEITVTSIDAKFLQKLINVIEIEMHRPDFTVEEIARIMNVSKATLNRKINSITNLSPGALVRWMRLKKAQNLLKSGAATISEIAFEVGYDSLSHFSQIYKRQFGLRPSDDFASSHK
jgi:signal transduction histidine kinase/ligand-binding sensor domain-containing protein/DNA-binding response OmpR family regulator